MMKMKMKMKMSEMSVEMNKKEEEKKNSDSDCHNNNNNNNMNDNNFQASRPLSEGSCVTVDSWEPCHLVHSLKHKWPAATINSGIDYPGVALHHSIWMDGPKSKPKAVSKSARELANGQIIIMIILIIIITRILIIITCLSA